MGKLTLQWRKSSASAQDGNCLEMAVRKRVMVRNSLRPDREVVSVSLDSWVAFVDFVRTAGSPGSGE